MEIVWFWEDLTVFREGVDHQASVGVSKPFPESFSVIFFFLSSVAYLSKVLAEETVKSVHFFFSVLLLPTSFRCWLKKQ